MKKKEESERYEEYAQAIRDIRIVLGSLEYQIDQMPKGPKDITWGHIAAIRYAVIGMRDSRDMIRNVLSE